MYMYLFTVFNDVLKNSSRQSADSRMDGWIFCYPKEGNACSNTTTCMTHMCVRSATIQLNYDPENSQLTVLHDVYCSLQLVAALVLQPCRSSCSLERSQAQDHLDLGTLDGRLIRSASSARDIPGNTTCSPAKWVAGQGKSFFTISTDFVLDRSRERGDVAADWGMKGLKYVGVARESEKHRSE